MDYAFGFRNSETYKTRHSQSDKLRLFDSCGLTDWIAIVSLTFYWNKGERSRRFGSKNEIKPKGVRKNNCVLNAGEPGHF